MRLEKRERSGWRRRGEVGEEREIQVEGELPVSGLATEQRTKLIMTRANNVGLLQPLLLVCDPLTVGKHRPGTHTPSASSGACSVPCVCVCVREAGVQGCTDLYSWLIEGYAQTPLQLTW